MRSAENELTSVSFNVHPSKCCSMDIGIGIGISTPYPFVLSCLVSSYLVSSLPLLPTIYSPHPHLFLLIKSPLISLSATGQDETLKSELRMAGLRHFALACTYGHRAQRIELVIQAGTVAWNVMVRMLRFCVCV